jgi:hypothetical protein
MITPDDNPIPADVLADMQAVADALAAGKLVGPEIAQRIRERSEKAQAELLRQYGMREIAIDLIREIRDEE